jgi:hypothetical protein
VYQVEAISSVTVVLKDSLLMEQACAHSAAISSVNAGAALAHLPVPVVVGVINLHRLIPVRPTIAPTMYITASTASNLLPLLVKPVLVALTLPLMAAASSTATLATHSMP